MPKNNGTSNLTRPQRDSVGNRGGFALPRAGKGRYSRRPEWWPLDVARRCGPLDPAEKRELDIVVGLALLGLTLYTSTLSYALRTFSRARLADHLSESQQRLWFERLDRYVAELQALMGAVRLACGLATVAFAYWAFLAEIDPEDNAVGLAIATTAALLILMTAAVAIPSSLALHAGETILASSLGLLWMLRTVLYPIERMLMVVDFIVRRLLGKRDETAEDESERHEQEILDAVTEGELHGAVDEEQKEMIESVFELHDTPVSAIMAPRTDMLAIAVDASFSAARKTIVEAGHSRIPVYEESLDHIVGVLYAKDLLALNNDAEFDVRTLMRTVPFVPETKTLDHLLRELRQEKVHIAIVLDEYGGTAGLVTIEDILEELVGEIDDEYDRTEAPTIQRIDNDTLEVDARVHVDEVNEELAVQIPENGSYETIGGFVFTTMGRIPAQGDELTHGNLRIKVLDAEPRKINRLRIRVERSAGSA